MNIQAPETTDIGTEGERQVLLLCYVLHALVFSLISSIIAVILDHLKAAETTSPFIRSHHRWLLRTFWWGLLWVVLCSPFCLILIGYPMLAIVLIWWMYRIIRGALAFADRRPMLT